MLVGMGSGLGSVYIPPGNEPGKERAAWSGHDGQHVTMVELLAEARATIDAGDVKSAHNAVSAAIAFNAKRGRGLGLPAEAPEQKSLLECQYQLDLAQQDFKFLGVVREGKLNRASEYLWQAESFTR